MPNKRYALIVRLWQVQGNSMLDAALSSAESERTTEADVAQSHEFAPHWRGSIQLVGDSQIRYFDSLHEISHLLAQILPSARLNSTIPYEE
ncbi:MAG: hypothetical protein U0175_18745 [Caldilineaceae bacterium]